MRAPSFLPAAAVSCCVVLCCIQTAPPSRRKPPTFSRPQVHGGPKQPLTTCVDCAPHLSRRSTPPPPLKPNSRVLVSFWESIIVLVVIHGPGVACSSRGRPWTRAAKANRSGRARSKWGAALRETSTNARSPTRSEVCAIVTQSCRSGYSVPELHRTKSTASGPMMVGRSILEGDAWSLLNFTRPDSPPRAHLGLSSLEEAHVRSWLGKRPQQRRFSGRFRLKARHADHLGKTKNAYQSGGGNQASTRSSKLTPF